ncbi:coatomer protein [Neoconidiobolus thromboides FSU 785]|nr:coatomer protein [Neoconidiobolus thromboides FSU 785]
MSLSLYSVHAFLILDNEGKRVLANYYTRNQDSASQKKYSNLKDQRKFETSLFKKTSKGKGSDIILYDGNVVLFRYFPDIIVYVVGDAEENELLLNSVLEAFSDSVASILRAPLEKRSIIENIDCIALVLDEIIDDGIILEVDTEKITFRVSKRSNDMGELQINEQTILQAYNTAKERIARSLLS